MQKPGDDLLVAYLDGELDDRQNAEIEAWLERDHELRDRVARLGESAALIKAAFDEDLREPLPERLIASARGETLGADALPGKIVPFRAKAKLALERRSWIGLLAAASLFGLMVGGGAVYWVAPETKPQTPSVATTNWLDNIAGYHRLITMAATGENMENTFDAPANADAGKISSRLPQQGGLSKVPDLKPWGLTFEGARYLIIEGRPAAQLFYKSDNKNLGPLTVVVASSKRQDLSPTFERRDDVNMLYWRRGGRAYAVAGQADKGWLWGLANDIGWQLNAI